MNNLLSSSFPRDQETSGDIEMGTDGGATLDKFFEDVETIKEELKGIDEVLRSLEAAHEESRTAHSARAVKDLRDRMSQDVSRALKKAKTVKARLEALDRSNEVNRGVAGCGPGSSADRTRSSVVGGLRKKLKEKMDEFQEVRERMNGEYRETVERRYFTVTGETPDEKTVDLLISTGESETFLQKAIQNQGRGQILDTIAEIQERHDAVRDIERSLNELHQVFLDMAVLVNQQGEQIDDIKANVERARSYVDRGTQQLNVARKHQKNTRKWTCFAIILILIIVLIIVLSLHPWS